MVPFESTLFFLKKLDFEKKFDNLAKTFESQVQSKKTLKIKLMWKDEKTKLPKFLVGKWSITSTRHI